MAEQLAGERGVLTVDRLVVRGAEEEEYLLVSGTRGDNASVNPEAAEKLFSLPGELRDGEIAEPGLTRVQHEAERHRKAVESRSAERNSARLQEEREKLFRWAEDQEKAVEQELERTKEEIKRLNREARQAQTIDEQKSIQEKISSLDRKKRKLRQEIFQVEDEIQARRDELLDKLEARVQQDVEWERLFTVGWEVE
jgi:chromosome segregation ATPase